MQKIKTVFIFLIFYYFFAHNVLYAWDNDITHRDLSEIAARKSVLGTQDYLKNIGFSKGLDEKVNGKEVFKWIRDGTFLEDQSDWGFPLLGTTRSVNHFHNPTKPWAQAGLDDWFIRHYTGESSLLWAQDGSRQQTFIGGDWSWQKIRDYYYLALTSKTDEERQASFAKTFRGLGHQVHLIEDAAQPDHVRNDAHPEDTMGLSYGIGIEKWAGENRSFINSLASNPTLPGVSLNISYNNLVPITQFIDAEQYNGANPSPSLAQGISEYTNSNYFSGDTVFSAERYSLDHRHYFPYPKRSSTDLQKYIDGTKPPETIIAEDGAEDTGIWISKVADGESIHYFVRPSFLTPIVYELFGEGSLYYSTFYRDEECHKDYAQKLIPRAVGYSAGLLNYFFRGEMEAVNQETIKDSSGNITGLKMKVKNNTPDEAMSSTEQGKQGRLIISYQYKNLSGNEVYGVSDEVLVNEVIASGKESTSEFTFTFNPSIPPDAEDIKYMLAYRGKLGNEEDAVVGKEISLILPLVFLIYQDAQNNPAYAVWKISKHGERLSPIAFDLGKYATFITIAPLERPSVVKSGFDLNDKHQKHVYTIEDLFMSPSVPYLQYGKFSGYQNELLVGLRNCFIDGVFDGDFGYAGYDPFSYICSGRNSSYIDNNGDLIKDLELWKIDTTSGQIKYKVKNQEDGSWSERLGSIISYSNSDGIYAVIAKDKVVGAIGETVSEDYQIDTPFTVVGCPYPRCDSEPRTYVLNHNSSVERGGKYFYFGSIQIDFTGLEKIHNQTLIIVDTCLCYGWEDCGVYNKYMADSVTSNWTPISFTPLDYDNINEDETFILFYAKTGWWYYKVENGGNLWSGWSRANTYNPSVKYYMAYRIKNGSLAKEEICWYGDFEKHTWQGGFKQTYDGPYVSSCIGGWWSEGAIVTETKEGQRILYPSTNITDKYILYSYILEDYFISPGVPWTFNKRILGIIDIETGTRTEHEVNDTLLGQYKDTFDKALPSAIGFHNGR